MRNNEFVLVFFFWIFARRQSSASRHHGLRPFFMAVIFMHQLLGVHDGLDEYRMAQKVRREEQPSPVSPESGEDYRIGRTMPGAAARQVLDV